MPSRFVFGKEEPGLVQAFLVMLGQLFDLDLGGQFGARHRHFARCDRLAGRTPPLIARQQARIAPDSATETRGSPAPR